MLIVQRRKNSIIPSTGLKSPGVKSRLFSRSFSVNRQLDDLAAASPTPQIQVTCLNNGEVLISFLKYRWLVNNLFSIQRLFQPTLYFTSAGLHSRLFKTST
jgi:hypothetical protein